MAKTSGLTTSVTVASKDLSNDITSISVDTPLGVQDVTGLDKSAFERLGLRIDFTGSMNGVFNTTADKSHSVLKTPGTKTMVIVYPGTATLTATVVTTNYAVAMGADGSLTWSVNFALQNGTAAAWT